jgi:hypothetical protein
MTSRQPGTTPPGTTGLVGTGGPGLPGSAAGDRGAGGRGAGGRGAGGRGAGDRAEPVLTVQDWLLRLLPLTLLIIVGLAGLRGAVGALRWNGPLHQDALIVGVVIEVFIVTMLVVLLIRRRSGSQEATAVKLRRVLLYVLGAGGVAAAVLMVAGLHLHAFSQHPRVVPSIRPPVRPSITSRPRFDFGAGPHISLTVLLYVLLVAALLAGIAVCVWLARRLRLPAAVRAADDDAAEQALNELAADLAEAEGGKTAEGAEGARGPRGPGETREQPDERACGPGGRGGHGQPLARGGA